MSLVTQYFITAADILRSGAQDHETQIKEHLSDQKWTRKFNHRRSTLLQLSSSIALYAVHWESSQKSFPCSINYILIPSYTTHSYCMNRLFNIEHLCCTTCGYCNAFIFILRTVLYRSLFRNKTLLHMKCDQCSTVQSLTTNALHHSYS